MPTNDQLRAYSLFAGLSDDELAGLAAAMTKRVFAKGVHLFYPGNPALNIYLVESGLVRVFFSSIRGEEIILNLLGPHTIVGLPVLMGGQDRMVGAAAHIDTAAWVISRENLLMLMQRSPRFLLNLYQDLCENLQLLGIYTQGLLFLDLSGRLARLFLYLTRGKKDLKNELELPLSQTELANWMGASRGRVNRALSKMQAARLIQISEQRILILDRPRLAQMAEGTSLEV